MKNLEDIPDCFRVKYQYECVTWSRFCNLIWCMSKIAIDVIWLWFEKPNPNRVHHVGDKIVVWQNKRGRHELFSAAQEIIIISGRRSCVQSCESHAGSGLLQPGYIRVFRLKFCCGQSCEFLEAVHMYPYASNDDGPVCNCTAYRQDPCNSAQRASAWKYPDWCVALADRPLEG